MHAGHCGCATDVLPMSYCPEMRRDRHRSRRGDMLSHPRAFPAPRSLRFSRRKPRIAAENYYPTATGVLLHSIATSAYRPTPLFSLSPPLPRKELGNPQLFRLSDKSALVWPGALNPPQLAPPLRSDDRQKGQQSAALLGSVPLSANGPRTEIPRPQIPLDLVGPKSDVS